MTSLHLAGARLEGRECIVHGSGPRPRDDGSPNAEVRFRTVCCLHFRLVNEISLTCFNRLAVYVLDRGRLSATYEAFVID